MNFTINELVQYQGKNFIIMKITPSFSNSCMGITLLTIKNLLTQEIFNVDSSYVNKIDVNKHSTQAMNNNMHTRNVTQDLYGDFDDDSLEHTGKLKVPQSISNNFNEDSSKKNSYINNVNENIIDETLSDLSSIGFTDNTNTNLKQVNTTITPRRSQSIVNEESNVKTLTKITPNKISVNNEFYDSTKPDFKPRSRTTTTLLQEETLPSYKPRGQYLYDNNSYNQEQIYPKKINSLENYEPQNQINDYTNNEGKNFEKQFTQLENNYGENYDASKNLEAKSEHPEILPTDDLVFDDSEKQQNIKDYSFDNNLEKNTIEKTLKQEKLIQEIQKSTTVFNSKESSSNENNLNLEHNFNDNTTQNIEDETKIIYGNPNSYGKILKQSKIYNLFLRMSKALIALFIILLISVLAFFVLRIAWSLIVNDKITIAVIQEQINLDFGSDKNLLLSISNVFLLLVVPILSGIFVIFLIVYVITLNLLQFKRVAFYQHKLVKLVKQIEANEDFNNQISEYTLKLFSNVRDLKHRIRDLESQQAKLSSKNIKNQLFNKENYESTDQIN